MQSDLMLIHSRRVGSRRENLIRKSACESSQSAAGHRGEERDLNTALLLYGDAMVVTVGMATEAHTTKFQVSVFILTALFEPDSQTLSYLQTSIRAPEIVSYIDLTTVTNLNKEW